MIRPATHDDIPALVGLGEIFLDSTILSTIAPYDPGSMAVTLGDIMDGEMGTVFVLVVDGRVVGGFCGLVVPLYWNLNLLAAQQLGFFVHPDFRGKASWLLLDVWEEWARSKGVTVFFSGAKKNKFFALMDRMLRRRGYQELESMHVKGVQLCPQ